MSHLPLEIILLILKHLVPLLSVKESVQLRSFNTLIAEEIHRLLFRHPTKDQEEFIWNRWSQCPNKALRHYLHEKLNLYPGSRCVFSQQAHEILQTQLQRTLTSDVPFVERVIDMYCIVSHEPWNIYDTSRYDAEMAKFTQEAESQGVTIEESAVTVLACSAIIRHDVNTLSRAIDYGLQMGQATSQTGKRFMELPICLAAFRGSKEIASLVVNRGFKIQVYKRYGKQYIVLFAAMFQNNMDALEVWLDHLRRENDEELQFNVAWMMRVTATEANFTMFNFLSRWFDGNEAELLYKALIELIEGEDKDGVAAILKHGGVNEAIWMEKYPTGPIFTILLAQGQSDSILMLERVLEGGINPDGKYPGVNGTPLQRAVEHGWLEVASTLIKFGADLNVSCVPHRMRQRSKVPLLLLAARKRNAEMVRLLLDNGADPASVKVDKTHGGFIQTIVDRKDVDLASVSVQNDA